MVPAATSWCRATTDQFGHTIEKPRLQIGTKSAWLLLDKKAGSSAGFFVSLPLLLLNGGVFNLARQLGVPLGAILTL
jgi:hypothetical protein